MEKQREPRVKKKIRAVFEGGTGIIENISSSGGFLKLNQGLPTDTFNIALKISAYKTLKMKCEPQWRNDYGVGFRVLEVEDSKEALFKQYVEKQLKSLELFGDQRVFKTEIVVTLKDTNVFGNVYFSNFIEYQGVVREKLLLSTVPDLHEMLAGNSIRLVTVEVYNKYVSNSYFGDRLLTELTTSEINAATCRLNIIFRNKGTGELVGEGFQRICIVGSKGKVMRIPSNLLDILDFYQEVKD